jgi:hypothetical protein
MAVIPVQKGTHLGAERRQFLYSIGGFHPKHSFRKMRLKLSMYAYSFFF